MMMIMRIMRIMRMMTIMMIKGNDNMVLMMITKQITIT